MSIFNGGVEKSNNDSSSGGIYKIGVYPVYYSDGSSQSYSVSINGFTDLDKMIFLYDKAFDKVRLTTSGDVPCSFYISSRSTTSVTLECPLIGDRYTCIGTLYVIQFK